jgi:hypothetical protein
MKQNLLPVFVGVILCVGVRTENGAVLRMRVPCKVGVEHWTKSWTAPFEVITRRKESVEF